MSIDPLGDIRVPPEIAALPKVDLHNHAEAILRHDQVLARRRGYKAFDPRPVMERSMRELPPGLGRLSEINSTLYAEPLEALDEQPDYTQARFHVLMEEAAADGAVYVEVRCGGETPSNPHFMSAFRAAESSVRRRYPNFRAEALTTWTPSDSEPERREARVRWGLAAAGEGLAGVDFHPSPYDTEADFTRIYRWAEKAAEAGMGIAAHAGEFSTANILAALNIPGLTRLGHAVRAPMIPGLLEELARRQITVEVCLSCNVILGAVRSYEEHPIRRFVEAGVRVTLATDDPARICTTIGREYAIAHALGFTLTELRSFTLNGIEAAFTTPERKAALRVATGEAPGPLDASAVAQA